MSTLDTFASKETTPLKKYMSWMAYSNAVGRDAMLCKWDAKTYLFPPVPLIQRTLNKIVEEEIEAILICPHWPSSLWWLMVEDLLLAPPLPLPPFREILTPVQGNIEVYLEPLVATLISGRV